MFAHTIYRMCSSGIVLVYIRSSWLYAALFLKQKLTGLNKAGLAFISAFLHVYNNLMQVMEMLASVGRNWNK